MKRRLFPRITIKNILFTLGLLVLVALSVPKLPDESVAGQNRLKSTAASIAQTFQRWTGR